jgi:hypothetical protein
MMDKKDDEVQEEVKEIIRRKRANTGRLNITVRNVVRDVINANAEYYSDALLQLIPKEILGTDLADENLHRIGLKIDNIRFKKEDELAIMFQIVKPNEKDMKKLEEVINGTDKMAGELNSSQKEKIKEIKFLSNIAQTIIHQ